MYNINCDIFALPLMLRLGLVPTILHFYVVLGVAKLFFFLVMSKMKGKLAVANRLHYKLRLSCVYINRQIGYCCSII